LRGETRVYTSGAAQNNRRRLRGLRKHASRRFVWGRAVEQTRSRVIRARGQPPDSRVSPGDIGATPRQTGALTSYETVVVKQAQR